MRSVTDLELILTMLGEATATTLHRERESQGIPELQRDAREAGDVAGSTRKDIEARTGKKVVSPNNYLDLPKARQRQLTDASSSQEAEQEEKR